MMATIPSLPQATLPLSGAEVAVLNQVQGGVSTTVQAPVSALGVPTLADLAASNGSSLVGFLQAGTGAVAETVQSKLQQVVSVKDFGALGNGVANDTAAFQAAFAACEASRSVLHVPAGTYIVTGLTYEPPGDAAQISIIGDGPNSTIITVAAPLSVPVLTIGSATATYFAALITVSGITFNGGSAGSSTPAALVTYDLVRSRIVNCNFSGAQSGVICNGGIDSVFEDCRMFSNLYGVKINKFTSDAGGGYPNNMRFVSCDITLNTTIGMTVDNSRAIFVIDCDIEGNGSGTVNAGAIYVGPSMGSEVDATGLHFGLCIIGGWMENNTGIAHIEMESGRNSISNLYINSASGVVTNDIIIQGGTYSLFSVDCDTTLSPNVLEGSLSTVGNVVLASNIPNITFNAALTTVIRNGAISTPTGYSGQSLKLTGAAPTVSAGQVGFGSGTGTVVGAAGSASALPSLPVGYLTVNIGGTNYNVPYYNA